MSTKRTRDNTSTTTKVIKKDEVDWSKTNNESNNETEKEQEELILDSEKKDVYNVSVFIPFDVNSSASNISNVSNKFINYYAGMQLALKELESMGLSLNVKVFDSKSNFNAKLRDPFNEVADVIIGPYDKENLKSVAEFGKENGIAVISPWNASKKITNQNPYFVQLNPPATDHYKKITNHISSNFSPDQVFLLQRDNGKDDKLNKYIQRYLNSQNKGASFNEYELNEDSLQMGDHAYDSLFLVNRPTVFVIPNYSSNDENYIYNAIRRISTEKGNNEVYIYGMPILMNSDRFTYDYYKNLNIRTCLTKLINHNDQGIKDFEQEYLRNYNALPTEDALEGYDLMNFVGVGLFEHGTKFFRKMIGDQFRGIQSIYNLQGMQPSDPMTLENEPKVEYYQNMHLDIIEYQNNGFQRLN